MKKKTKNRDVLQSKNALSQFNTPSQSMFSHSCRSIWPSFLRCISPHFLNFIWLTSMQKIYWWELSGSISAWLTDVFSDSGVSLYFSNEGHEDKNHLVSSHLPLQTLSSGSVWHNTRRQEASISRLWLWHRSDVNMHALCTLRTHFVKRLRESKQLFSRCFYNVYSWLTMTTNSWSSPGICVLLKGTMVTAHFSFFEGIEPVTLFNGPDF